MRKTIARFAPIPALLAALFFLPGCMMELLTTTAIQSELQAQSASAAMGQLNQARRMADEIKISQAIDIYRAENGANPPSLSSLVPDYLDAVPLDPAGRPLYAYDPATGWFGDAADAPAARGGASAGGVTPQDEANLEQIATALDDYHAMYGAYPEKLAQLAPRFIDAIPMQAVSRKPYVYFPDTGEIRHPAEVQAGPAPAYPQRRSSMPISGGSPLAEQVEAIGMMNEMNAQPNPTGGRARQQVQGIGTQQNQQYDTLMDDLDL